MIMNILEMREDYDVICERVSELRELPTREQRVQAARDIMRDHRIVFEGYALLDMIGKEFFAK